MKSTSPRRNTISTDIPLAKGKNALPEKNAMPTSRQTKSVSFDQAVRPAMFTRSPLSEVLSTSDRQNISALPKSGNFSPRPGKENYVFKVPDTFLQSGSDLSARDQLNTASKKIEADLGSPRLVARTAGLPLHSYSAPASMLNSPASTPRAPHSAETKENHIPRENSLKKIGREISNTLESISPRLKSTFSSARLGSSSPDKVIANSLLNLSDELLDILEQKVRDIKNSRDFQLNSAHQKNIILRKEILQNLPADSEFQDKAKLKLLVNEINERIANADHGIDREIDLTDPDFFDFINRAADAAFIKPWQTDRTDVQDSLKHYLNDVKPTFARDFEHSNYFVRNADGSLEKLSSIDAFIAFTKSDSLAELPKVVSNIASQNLGNFIKNALFLRQDTNRNYHSILNRRNGAPVMPLATVKASYVFRKNNEGSILIDYNWSSSKAINGAKEMRAREMLVKKNSDKETTYNIDTFGVKNASLDIRVTIKIEPDGEWQIFNPHVKANGWT